MTIEYFDRLVKAKDVYNDLYNNTASFQDYGYSNRENLEIASSIIYLLGAIMNHEKIEVKIESVTNKFLLSLDKNLYDDILPFINFA